MGHFHTICWALQRQVPANHPMYVAGNFMLFNIVCARKWGATGDNVIDCFLRYSIHSTFTVDLQVEDLALVVPGVECLILGRDSLSANDSFWYFLSNCTRLHLTWKCTTFINVHLCIYYYLYHSPFFCLMLDGGVGWQMCVCASMHSLSFWLNESADKA